METKNWSTINLTRKQIKDVSEFCKLNKIEDIDTFLQDCLTKGYEIEKFGLLDGSTPQIIEKEVEKIVYKEIEKVIEVPVIEYVDIVKEVPVDKVIEVIKEVPIERVFVKEVPVEVIVEKEVYITDDQQVKELGSKITELENGMSKKEKELDELKHTLDELLAKPPVEIIKEIPTVVEKTTVDLTKQKALEETIQKLRNELQLKNKEIKDLTNTIQELQTISGRQSVYLEGSNLNKVLKRK